VGDTPIENLLAPGERFAPPPGARVWTTIADQDEWNAEAARDPLAFWRSCAERLAWESAPQTVLAGNLGNARWFPDGRLNATVSCLDRHAATHPAATAYLNLCEDGSERRVSYRDLLAATNRLANALRADGVEAGDRVCVYMPLSVEGIVAMLACARIGAVHSVVYAGLGATALRERIEDAGAGIVLGADVTYRRGREIDLKAILDDAVGTLAEIAAKVNSRSENIGARRLHTVLERVLDELSFNAPELQDREITVDAAYVHRFLDPIVKDEDLSRFIL